MGADGIECRACEKCFCRDCAARDKCACGESAEAMHMPMQKFTRVFLDGLKFVCLVCRERGQDNKPTNFASAMEHRTSCLFQEYRCPNNCGELMQPGTFDEERFEVVTKVFG